MKCCCDVDLPIVRTAFAKRNWTQVEPHQDWNIYWTSVANARCLMAPDSNTRLSENQRVNHFPTHYELTRKDLLARHMQRYQRQRSKALQRDEPPPPAIVPSTYVLPRDYSMFVDEYKKRAGGGSSLWIVKPCGKAQGIGIKLVDRPSQVKSLINSWESQGNRESHVLCRYVDPPLLVGGRKFDLRLYVLVTSFQPVHAFLAATTSPTVASGASPAWRRSCGGHGAPRPLLGCAKTSGSWWRTRSQPSRLYGSGRCLVFAAPCCASFLECPSCDEPPSMLSDWHCFECYGYDVLLDEDLRPWLLEVNASPSLTSSTRADARLKQALVDDVLRLAAPSGRPRPSACSEADLGDFEQILPAAQTPP
ncbi:tubulin tyrosine ligase-like 1B isoform X3 [Dermacentor variabilis]|uniref:tubulin tyrosine ligase-like 1B isoform X3 n=1 Tax=Dermacentor variabilis TaxID=34621 RepID=UPI003F5B2F0C